MADVTIRTQIPNGTSVGAYSLRQLVDGQVAPVGAPLATTTVAGRSMTFGGLPKNSRFLAYVNVNGHDFIQRFATYDKRGPAFIDETGTIVDEEDNPITSGGAGPPGPPGPPGNDAVAASDAVRGASDRFYRLVAGALRYNGSGWDLVNDTFSRPQNVDEVTTDAAKITIQHATIGALHTGSFAVVPSEDLLAVGIRPIVKPGITSTDILLRQDRTLSDFASWSGSAWVLSKGTGSPFQLSGLDGSSDDYPAVVQATAGLQAYYRFSDASGAVIQDELVGNHDGVVVSTGTTYGITSGAPVITDPTPDKAMRVATGGTNEFTFALMGLMTQAAFSVEMWVKCPVGGSALIRDQAVSTTQGYWIGKQIASGMLMYRMGTGTVQVTAYPWANLEGVYRHIVWTKNGANGKLYIDGVLVHSSTGQPSTALQSPWHIGRGGYSATTQDSQAVEISEAAFYNAEVVAADVKEHYYAAKANGVLRVTHADVGTTSPGGLALTPRGSLVRPVLGDNVTASSFEVKFYDPANTLLTVPTTDMKVAIQRSVSERRVPPDAFTAIVNVSGDDYDAAVEADGPISYWTLGDTVGATTAAAAVGTPTGAIGSGVTMGVTGLLAADPHTAAQFDGSANGKIVFPSPALVTGTALSLEIWFKRTGVGTVGLTNFSAIMGWTSSAGTRRLLLKDDGSFLIAAGGANLTTAGNIAADNVVHHLVYTWDLLTQRLYVDGVLIIQGNTAGISVVQPIILGGYDNPVTNYAFKGQKARFAIYNKALTTNQIQAHYATGAGVVLTVDRAVGSQLTFQSVLETNAPPVTPPPEQPLPTPTPLPDGDLGAAVTGSIHIDQYRSDLGAPSSWIKRALPSGDRSAILLNGLTVNSISYPAATSNNWRASLCSILGIDPNTSQAQALPTVATPMAGISQTTPMWLGPSLRMYVVPADQPLHSFQDQDVTVGGWAAEINAIVADLGGYPMPADARPDPSPDRYAYFFQPDEDRMITVYDFHGSIPATTKMSLTGTPSTGAFGFKFLYRDNALAATTTYFGQTLIAYNATAAQVKAAIDGSKTASGATFGTNGARPGSYYGSCVVTGGPLNINPITISFPSVDPLQPVGFALDTVNFYLNSGTVEFEYTNAGPYDRGRLSSVITPSPDGSIPTGISTWTGSYSQKTDLTGQVWMDARWGATATGIDPTPLIPSPEEFATAQANGTSLGHIIPLRIGNCMGTPFRFVYPANRGDGTFIRSDASMITEGALITLPEDVDLSAVIPEFLPIARTLRDYGAVIYDKTGTGSEFTFRNTAFPDTTLANLWLDLLPLYKTTFDAPLRYMRSIPWHKVEIISPAAMLAGW